MFLLIRRRDPKAFRKLESRVGWEEGALTWRNDFRLTQMLPGGFRVEQKFEPLALGYTQPSCLSAFPGVASLLEKDRG